jgi:hypothetical protein
MNTNPITIGKIADTPTVFTIPEKFGTVMLYLTLKVTLLEEGFQFASKTNVNIELTNIFRKPFEPVDLKLARGSDIHERKITTSSFVSPFPDGKDLTDPCPIEYKLILEGGDDLINEFSIVSNEVGAVNFYSFILFQQL